MKTPFGVAGFDSAAGLLRATALAVGGKDFPALGHPKPLQYVVRLSDILPVGLRRQVYAAATGVEGVSRNAIGRVDLDRIADWVTDQFPQARYPTVFIGSSSGAVSHLATALGAAWLPQTFLIAMRRSGGGIDDPKGDLDQAREPAATLLAANPGVQLHQMHDPSQDRLSLQYITYLRTKYTRLPPAYRQFLRDRIVPGGTIILTECTKRWPTRRITERHFFQFGAVGGMEPQEYFDGSPRVADYLKRYGVGRDRWDPPEPDGEAAEAEWGFEAALRDEIEELARAGGLRVLRLMFDDPEDPSPAVADFHRDWYRQRGLKSNRLLVSSFILMEPYWALRTGAAPFWATFNSGPSCARLRSYLQQAEPYDEIRMMIFPHGTKSVGLPAIDDWRSCLQQARQQGAFVGVNERAYPYHFSALARYHLDIRRISARYPIPAPLPFAAFERFLAQSGTRYPIRLVSL
jgi:hypothetical protein